MKSTVVIFTVTVMIAGVLSCELPDLDWHPLVPNEAEDWAAVTANTAPAACARDAQGFVHLRGKLTDTSPENYSVVFQLPPEGRPAYPQDLAVGVWESSTGAYGIGRLTIYANGSGTLQGANGATLVYVYLDGVVFDSN